MSRTIVAGRIVMLFLAGGFASPAAAQRLAAADSSLPRRPQLGVLLDTLPTAMRATGVAGAYARSVVAGSAAAAAGLRVGDVVTGVRARGGPADSIRTVADALAALRRVTPGTTATLSIVRDGRATTLRFTAREWPRERAPDFDVEYTAVRTPTGRRRVIVTHPRGGAAHPAVLIVGGIGCYSIDAATGPLAYRDLAYDLTRRGYTTVRVEKSGVGDSEGAPCPSVDLETELSGYAAALDAMRRYPWVDPARIVVFGHSIGGIVAPLLVGRDSTAPPVRAIALLSVVGVSWYEYELANLRRQLRLGHQPPDSIEAAMRRKTVCMYQLLIERVPRAKILAQRPECAAHFPYPASDAYMQQVAAVDQAALWRPVAVPTLVMYGSSDFVTDREEHLELVERINAFHPGMGTFADVAETDHYISHRASPQASFDDTTSGLARPYYGTAVESVLEGWLSRVLGP